jgi:hypothetical protein
MNHNTFTELIRRGYATILYLGLTLGEKSLTICMKWILRLRDWIYTLGGIPLTFSLIFGLQLDH